MAARALINVPAKAKRGEIVPIRVLISHEMESGLPAQRHGRSSRATSSRSSSAPITASRCSAPSCFPAMSANPFIAFSTVATESGTLTLTWTGDNGFHATESVAIAVE